MALAGNLRTKLLTHTFVGRDMLNATGTIAVIGFDGGAEFFDPSFVQLGFVIIFICTPFETGLFYQSVHFL